MTRGGVKGLLRQGSSERVESPRAVAPGARLLDWQLQLGTVHPSPRKRQLKTLTLTPGLWTQGLVAAGAAVLRKACSDIPQETGDGGGGSAGSRVVSHGPLGAKNPSLVPDVPFLPLWHFYHPSVT